MPRQTLIAPRRGTASFWTTTNPILGDGEMGLETDTGKVKFGNGTAGWIGLPYGLPGGSGLQTLDPPGAWTGWKLALANMANAPAKILTIGDSITEGTGVTTRSATWPNQLAELVRYAYPSVPQTAPWGWVPIAQASSTLPSHFTLAGSYDTLSTFGFRGNQSVKLNTNATITFSVKATSIDIWHAKGTSTGTFTVLKNGVQVGGNYGGTNASTASGFKQTISLGASATYTIVITCNSANSVYITGVTAWDGNESSGVVVANAGRHGWSSQNWEDTANHPNWYQDIATYDPHLVTILLGANDYTSSVGRTAYKDNIRTVINKIRDSQSYFSSIVLISCFKRSESALPKWEHYEFALRDLATEMGCAYIDLRDVMPDVGTTEANNAGYYVDTVHASASGYTRIASEISKVLLDPTIGTKPDAPYLEPIVHTHGLASDTVSGFMSPSMKADLEASVRATPGHKFRQIACVVRNTGSGFDFISDSGHYPSGVSSITTAGDGLSFTINYSFTASQVGSLVATADETLAIKGYTIGGSVGLSSATFHVGQGGGFSDYVSWNGSAWVSLNGYITSASMNATTGLITCNHVDMSNPVGGSVTSRSLTKRASMEGLGATTTTLYLVDNAGVTVKTPTTDNRFWINRGGARRVPMSELTYANSNIWIYGLMLVD